ncbi:MAG: transpeptidase family protein [Dysgonamonadaceae bacterium]|jgi:cell division protein FtsI (penicillin-binding protein 3)|nr:transpeptidase family protein [Dysgonamonadaceae bacterium]
MAKKALNSKILRNYFVVALIFGIIVIAIIGRACYTSFITGKTWKKLESTLKRPNKEIAASRGNIYSSDYRLMATSESLYHLYIDFWADGLQEDTLMKYVGSLAEGLHAMYPEKSAGYYKNHILNGWNMRQKEAEQINKGKTIARKSREYSLLDRKMNYLELKEIRKLPFLSQNRNKSGLYTKEFLKRSKPFGTLASRTIGDIYGDFEKGGKNGLELEYDSLLRGVPGVSMIKKIYGRTTAEPLIYPVNGKDIVTTIDIDIQDITEKALLHKLREIDAESGTAVVMEVSTGEIKAITNMGRIREGVWTETKNHAVADETEPGSTFKVVSMMVALEDGVVHPDDTVETGNGLYTYAGSVVRDHNAHRGGYGTITASKSIRYSSNVGVAKIILKGYENNPSKFVEGIYKIGLNQDFNLEIPGAGRAKIRSPKDSSRYWSKTTLPWMSFGYETQVPPIYTLAFFNAIANNGRMVKPFFVKEIRDDNKVLEKKKTETINKQICSPNTLKQIRIMLDDVVNQPDGTGKPAYSKYVRISGKTGTAQISQGAAGYKSGGLSHQVSFCGYFPSDEPKYSCIVLIRKPRNGAPSGGLMCGTVFKTIAEEVYARSLFKKVDKSDRDTINPLVPRIKNGFYSQTEYALNKLDIAYKDSVGSDKNLISVAIINDKLVLSDRKIIDNLAPNVTGMGARDAVFILENAGLRVNLSGRGTVYGQSITPGTKIVKGQTISIQLK